MAITKNISANLNAWMNARPDLGTLELVEKKSHVAYSTIRRARNGDGNPTINNLCSIANAFGKSVEELLAPPEEKSDATVIREPQGKYEVKDEIETLLIELGPDKSRLWSAKLEKTKAELNLLQEEIRAAANEARQEKTRRESVEGQELKTHDPPLDERRAA